MNFVNKYLTAWQNQPILMGVCHIAGVLTFFNIKTAFKNEKIKKDINKIDNSFIDKWKSDIKGEAIKVDTAQVITLIDTIHDKLAGANIYVYPEIVNKLNKLSIGELKFAYAYFNKVYTPAYNESLTQFLKNEMSSYKYAPAIGRLEKNNLL